MKLTLSLVFVSLAAQVLAFDDLALPANISELFMTAHRQEIVKTTEVVEVSRLEAISGTPGSPPVKYSDYREIAVRTTSDEDRKKIVGLLLDDATYQWPKEVLPDGSIRIIKHGCRPFYYFRTRVTRGRESIELSFCFTCRSVLVAQNGVAINAAFLGSRSDELLAIFRSLLPTPEKKEKEPNQSSEPMPLKRHGSP